MFTKKIRQFSLLLIVAMLVAVVTSQVALGATAQGGWYPTATPSWNKPVATPTKNWNSWQPTPTKSWNKPAATPTKNWNSWQPTPTKSWNKPTATPTKNWNKPAATPTKNWNKPAATPTKSWNKPTATPVVNQEQPEILSFEAKVLRSFPNGDDEIEVKWKAKNTAGYLVNVLVAGTVESNHSQIYSQLGVNDGEFRFTYTEDDRNIILILAIQTIDYNHLMAKELVTVFGSCKIPYFFDSSQYKVIGSNEDVGLNCPRESSVIEKAVYQKFEHGFMLWIESTKTIEVYSDVAGYGPSPSSYEDTWDSSQPISDPTLKPPAGLYQPQYGFGKLWRDPKFSIRNALGWATSPEVGYNKLSQSLTQRGFSSEDLFSTPDNIVYIWGSNRYHYSGGWLYLKKN